MSRYRPAANDDSRRFTGRFTVQTPETIHEPTPAVIHTSQGIVPAEPASKLRAVAKPCPREAEVGRLCDQLAERMGWTVERYEQRRATRITEGLPDRRYVREDRGDVHRVWVELKAPDGKLTRAQHAWLARELTAGGYATALDSPQALAEVLTDVRHASAATCIEHLRRIAARGFRRERKAAA